MRLAAFHLNSPATNEFSLVFVFSVGPLDARQAGETLFGVGCSWCPCLLLYKLHSEWVQRRLKVIEIDSNHSWTLAVETFWLQTQLPICWTPMDHKTKTFSINHSSVNYQSLSNKSPVVIRQSIYLVKFYWSIIFGNYFWSSLNGS